MPTGAEEVAAAKAAVAIVDIAKEQGLLRRLRDVLRTKHYVLILGSTGTGKSNFVLSLKELVPEAIDHLSRTAFASRSRVQLAGTVFDFIDTPGQAELRARRLEAIRKALDQTRFGVINVVSWGYHEYKTGKSEAIAPDGGVDAAWLSTHREVELDSAAEWVPLVAGKPAYMITLVTKADLWWPEADNVIRYYEKGKYYRVVRDAALAGHVVVPYSSVFHNFYNEGALAGSFDAADREDCQKSLLQELFVSTAKS